MAQGIRQRLGQLTQVITNLYNYIDTGYNNTTSNFSGSTPPLNPVAGQGWFNPSNSQFSLRSSDNTTWVLVGTASDLGFQAALTAPILAPQGRLTLVSGSPIMATDVTSTTTILYDPYVGSYVPIFNGTLWVYLLFAETTLILDTTGHVAATNYDVYAYSNGGTLALGTGPAWSSGTSRGTAAAVSLLNGIWVNSSAMVLRNNSVNTGSIPANQATYLGTLRTSGAGVTTMQFKPTAAAGGNNTILGLWNAYNRVHISSRSQDSTATWTYTSSTWRAADNSNNNRIIYVDGLAQSMVGARYAVFAANSSSAGGSGVLLNATTGTPTGLTTETASASTTLMGFDHFYPQLGTNFVQAMESNVNNTGTVTFSGGSLMELQIDLDM